MRSRELRNAVPAWLLVPVGALVGAIVTVTGGSPAGLVALAAEPPSMARAFVGAQVAWQEATLSGLATGMAIFPLVIGVTLALRLLGQVTLVHAAFAAIGLLAGGHLASDAAADAWQAVPVAILMTTVAAMLTGTVLGYAADRLLLRPGRLRPFGKMRATVSFAAAGSAILALVPLLEPVATGVGRGDIALIGVGLAAFAGLNLMLRRSRAGLVLRAGAENPALLAILGHGYGVVCFAVLLVGAVLAGFWGLAWPMRAAPVESDTYLALAAAAVLIGGPRAVSGCLIACLLVGLFATYSVHLPAEALRPVAAVVLALSLAWRPIGSISTGGLPRSGASTTGSARAPDV